MRQVLIAVAIFISGIVACVPREQSAHDLAHILGYTQDCEALCWSRLVLDKTTEERFLDELSAVDPDGIAIQRWEVIDGSHWYQWHFKSRHNRVTYVTRFADSVLTRTYIEDLQTDLASLSEVIDVPSRFFVEDSGIPEKPGYHYAFYFPDHLIAASGFISREHACEIKHATELKISIITRTGFIDIGKYDQVFSQLENRLPVNCTE